MDSWGKNSDMVVHEREPYNAEPSQRALARRMLTPTSSFYSRNHGTIPGVDPDTWRLRVDGMVARPLRFSLSDLKARFEHREVVATLQCAGNRRAGLMELGRISGHPWGPGATSTADWCGVRLADVLGEAGLLAGASDVAFTAPDVATEATPPAPYGASISVGKAIADEVVLAWSMNGEPLPVAHGAPVRVVVPGYIGARSVKWLERITVQDHPSENFFQTSAYRLLPADAELARTEPGDGVELNAVALNSGILEPADEAVVTAGSTFISGYAFAGGDREIVRVDVSVDGGRSWWQAEMSEQAGPWVWRLWQTTVELPPGKAEIIARAWDTTAAVQPENPESVWNPKGYVNNSWPRISVTSVG